MVASLDLAVLCASAHEDVARERESPSSQTGTRCRRDVSDGALGRPSEAQGARATSSGGYFALGIHRTYPAPGTGGPRPVTGAIPGRQGRHENPIPLQILFLLNRNRVGKGFYPYKSFPLTLAV